MEVEIVASDLSGATRSYDHRPSKYDLRAVHDSDGGVPFTYLWAGWYQRNDWRRVLSMVLFGGSVVCLLMFRRLRRPTVFIGSSPHLVARVRHLAGIASPSPTLRLRGERHVA